MLSPKAQSSLADAKKYFKEHLAIGDYYVEGQQVLGQWHGKGAEDLGLSDVSRMEQFERLCDNLHPQTGQRLTLRHKTTRTDAETIAAEQRTPIAGCLMISRSRRQSRFPLPPWSATTAGLSRTTNGR
jgi:hypothetical protein